MTEGTPFVVRHRMRSLGVMFLGLSMLAARTHAMPYEGGVPSVISQVGKLVYGETAVGSRPLLRAAGRERC